MMSVYLLPLLLGGFALMFAFWRAERRKAQHLAAQFEQVRAKLVEREEEKDEVLKELFYRFSEEGKLCKE